ncbi:MAG: hypothetical protein SPM04_04470 [Lachnospira sp.]|nr:hypothetical protein [Lachnospira sp.]
MVKYEKPVLDVVAGFSENVYMASGNNGGGDCWIVGGSSVQDSNGSHHVFEIRATHSNQVEHISTGVTYVITFSAPITDASSEFPCRVSGNTVVVTRPLHANGYNSGDNVTFKVMAKGADDATTKALAITGISWSCQHATNVQGKYD